MNSIIFIYSIYLFYGLSFFILNVSIFSKDLKKSELEISKYLWLLGLFGFMHGVHEWVELFFVISLKFNIILANEYLLIIRVIFLTYSYLLLLLFGLSILRFHDYHLFLRRNIDSEPYKLYLAVTLLSILIGYASYLSASDRFIRNMIGFPAALSSGIGFILYSNKIGYISVKGSRDFRYSGIFMVLYGVLTGLLTMDSDANLFGLNVIFFRGLSAILITFWCIRALRTFDVEKMKILEKNMDIISQSDKLASIGRLAAGIAHGINNPLTNALLRLEMLGSRLEKESDLVNDISNISKNIEKASNIAKELLLFSREEKLEISKCKPSEFINSMNNILSHHKRIRDLLFELKDDLTIYCIFSKIEELILNLIMNAFDATDDGGKVLVSFEKYGTNLKITIADEGRGIHHDNLKKIFDPFFTTKGVGKGTGLGLYICYKIVKVHRGEIFVEKTTEKGTVFTVLIPENKE